jgi:hypothetical protein
VQLQGHVSVTLSSQDLIQGIKSGKLTRCSHQRPASKALGPLPLSGCYDNLRRLPMEDVRAQTRLPRRRAVVQRLRERQRRAGVVVPDLGRVDLVPVRPADGAFEEVVDGGADGAVAARHEGRVAERLNEVALLRIGRQVELGDDLAGRTLTHEDGTVMALVGGCGGCAGHDECRGEEESEDACW